MFTSDDDTISELHLRVDPKQLNLEKVTFSPEVVCKNFVKVETYHLTWAWQL